MGGLVHQPPQKYHITHDTLALRGLEEPFFQLCFFSGSNFFQLYVSTIIGARVKIRTPIMTQKNYDQKKRYSCLAGYVFRTTGKNYDPQIKGTIV